MQEFDIDKSNIIKSQLTNITNQLTNITNQLITTEGLVTGTGKIIEDFGATQSWIPNASTCTSTNNIVNTKLNYNSSSLRINGTTTGGVAKVDKIVSLDLSTMTSVSIWVYILDASQISTLTVYFTSSGTWSKWFSYSYGTIHPYKLMDGWNLLTIPKSSFDNQNSESWSNIMTTIRLGITPIPGCIVDISFDSMIINQSAKPMCLFTFDDAYKTVYSSYYPIMEAKGVKGTTWIVPTIVDGTNTNYMRKDDLINLQNHGWLISNHTMDHINLTTLTTNNEIKYQIQGGIDWLNINGFSKGVPFLCYPMGGYNSNIINIAKSVGIKSARTTVNGYQGNPIENLMATKTIGIDSTTTASTFNALVDKAVESGQTLIIMAHTGLNITEFTNMVAYAASKLDCITYDVWYNMVTGIYKFYTKF